MEKVEKRIYIPVLQRINPKYVIKHIDLILSTIYIY